MGIELNDPDVKVDAGFSVLYSGGLDSTAVPLRLGKKLTGPIHLLTLHHNYGNLFADWSKKHVTDLQRIFGDERVSHEIFNISPYFKRITLSQFKNDLFKYGHFIWCLGCMLSILTRAIIANLERKLPFIFVCSSVGGEYAIMSTPTSIECKNDLCAEFGIDYRAPLLELNMEKPEERALLNSHNIWPGLKVLKGVQGVQPICIPGFMHIMDNLFDIHTTPKPEKVGAYIRDKSVVIKEIIAEYFEEKSLDINAHIAELKSVRAKVEGVDQSG